MSSSLNAYAVSLDQLRQVVGSRDKALIDAIISGHARFLTTIDNIDEEADFSCAQAVAHLVNGEIDEDVPGYLYGYAVEATCLHVGRKLPNVCPIGSSWIEEV